MNAVPDISSSHQIKTTALPVMESFYTIQGEGYHQGRAAYFIRLGGCDVGCVWCDVKDSWDANRHPLLSIDTIVQAAADFPGRLAVITGGEPLMHNCGPLTKALKEKNFHTNIETSGSSPLSGDWDWICLSPKKFKAPLPSVIEKSQRVESGCLQSVGLCLGRKIRGTRFPRL